MSRKKVAVVGAGIAGLACAARLAAVGFSVDVFERNSEAGGKLGLLQDGGYSWDTGPSLFTQPFLLENLFKDCGRLLVEFFTYRALEEGTQYFWEGGAQLRAAPARETLAANVSEAFGISADGLMRYLDDARELYEKIGRIFLDEPIHRRNTWKLSRVIPALKALKLSYLTSSLHAYNVRGLKHPKLVQMMDRLAYLQRLQSLCLSGDVEHNCALGVQRRLLVSGWRDDSDTEGAAAALRIIWCALPHRCGGYAHPYRQ